MWAASAIRSWPSALRVAVSTVLAGVAALGAVVATYAYSDPIRTSIESESVFFAAITGRPQPQYVPRFDDVRALVREVDAKLAAGDIAVIDTRSGIPLLLSAHPRKFIVPEDRDFEQIMSDPTGRFQLVILGSGPTGTSAYRGMIEGAMSAAEGGSFEHIHDYGPFALWEFRADPS
jgi:hypothetical protein